MQCPKCAIENHRGANGCYACGADLLAPPPKMFTETGAGLLVAGTILGTIFATTDIRELARPNDRAATILVLIYLLFGKWPRVIALVGGGVVYLFRGWHERRAGSSRPTSQESPMPPVHTDTAPAPTVAGGTQLHRLLGAGLSLVAAVFVAMTLLGAAPLIAAEDVTPPVSYGLPVLAFAVVAAALLVIRPRVPDRTSMQTPDEFWARPEVGPNVVLIWFLLEGAGVLASVGFLLTGELPAQLAMGVAIVAYWWNRPSLFLRG